MHIENIIFIINSKMRNTVEAEQIFNEENNIKYLLFPIKNKKAKYYYENMSLAMCLISGKIL